MICTIFATLLLLAATPALAHPGAHHGTLLDAVAHLLSEPDHLALAAAAVLVGVLGARFFRRRSQRRRAD